MQTDLERLDEAYQKALKADSRKTWVSGYAYTMTPGERIRAWVELSDLRKELRLVNAD